MEEKKKMNYHKEIKWSHILIGRMITFILTKRWGIKLLNALEKKLHGISIKDLHCEEVDIPSLSEEGQKIRVRIFRPLNVKGKLPGMLYLHGGGFMIGNPEQFLTIIKQYIQKRPLVIVAPDYRKSLKNPYPAGFNDSYDTLLWMKRNAQKLGIIDEKFIIGGHSAGGGLTAAISIKARDTNEVNIAFQMPIYPMLDHRQATTSVQSMKKVPVWNTKTTEVAWALYLSDLIKQKESIPPYASPALNENYNDFPPTITFVAELEPFKDEVIAYTNALRAAGVPVKFQLYEGVFHSFETIAPKTSMAKKANEFQYEAFAEYYDQFFGIINERKNK